MQCHRAKFQFQPSICFAPREFSVFAKEKGDIADALLSLKQAIVHPGMTGGSGGAPGQLSPLSPAPLHPHHHQFHAQPGPPPPPGPPPCPPPVSAGQTASMATSLSGPTPTLSYTVNHQPQVGLSILEFKYLNM